MNVIKEINALLDDKYGRIDSYPKFRIVWADGQTEHRQIIGPDDVKRTEYVSKYNHIEYLHRYILEMFIPRPNNPELPANQHGSYEPLWAFKLRQEPIWKAVDMLIQFHYHGIEGLHKLSPAGLKDEDEKKRQKEIEEFMDILDMGYLPHLLSSGEAVGYTGDENAG